MDQTTQDLTAQRTADSRRLVAALNRATGKVELVCAAEPPPQHRVRKATPADAVEPDYILEALP